MFNMFLNREVKKKEEREEEERKNRNKEDEELKNMSLGEFKKEGEKDFGQLLEESKVTGDIDTSSKQYLEEKDREF